MIVFTHQALSHEALKSDLQHSFLQKRVPPPTLDDPSLKCPVRIAVVGSDRSDIKNKIEKTLNDKQVPGAYISEVTSRYGRVAFQFTGQGSQYINMGAELYNQSPRFRETLEQISRMNVLLGGPSLLDIMNGKPQNQSDINETRWAQLTIFAIQVGLYQLWAEMGIKPAAALGHSIGEISAASCLKAMSYGDCLKLIRNRGRLMQSLPSGGGMLAVFLDQPTLEKFLANRSIDIAAVNGPQSIVLSGPLQDLANLSEVLKENNIKFTSLHVSHGFHSRLMEPILDTFRNTIKDTQFEPTLIPIVSGVHGEVFSESFPMTADYWRDHISKPVHYLQALQSLHQQGIEMFLEIGPNKVLSSLGKKCLDDPQIKWLWSMQRGLSSVLQMAKAAAEAYTLGHEISWKPLGVNELRLSDFEPASHTESAKAA